MTSGRWQVQAEPIHFEEQGITRSEQHGYLSTTHWRLHRGLPTRIWREGYLFKLDEKSCKIFTHRRIPFQEMGCDHVGDLDFLKGLIYATLEDVKYERPKVVLSLDASTCSCSRIKMKLMW